MSDQTSTFTVRGPPGDENFSGTNGMEKHWPADELRKVAEKMDENGVPVVPANQEDNPVGTVTSAEYDEEYGALVFEMEIYDEGISQKIDHQIAKPAPMFYHRRTEECETISVNGEEIPVLEDLETTRVGLYPEIIDIIDGVVDDPGVTVPISEYVNENKEDGRSTTQRVSEQGTAGRERS